MSDDEGEPTGGEQSPDQVAVGSVLSTPEALDLLSRIHQQLVDLPAHLNLRDRDEREGLLEQHRELGGLTARSAALEERVRASESRAEAAEVRLERLIRRFFDFLGKTFERQPSLEAGAALREPPRPGTAGLRLRQIGVNLVSGLMLGIATVLLDHAFFPDGPSPLSPAALIANAISLATLALVFSYLLTPREGE